MVRTTIDQKSAHFPLTLLEHLIKQVGKNLSAPRRVPGRQPSVKLGASKIAFRANAKRNSIF